MSKQCRECCLSQEKSQVEQAITSSFPVWQSVCLLWNNSSGFSPFCYITLHCSSITSQHFILPSHNSPFITLICISCSLHTILLCYVTLHCSSITSHHLSFHHIVLPLSQEFANRVLSITLICSAHYTA